MVNTGNIHCPPLCSQIIFKYHNEGTAYDPKESSQIVPSIQKLYLKQSGLIRFGCLQIIQNLLLMKFIILLTLVLIVLARDDPKYDSLYRKSSQNIKSSLLEAQEMHWFSQVVDHYDYRQEQRFNQRYWVVKDYFNPKTGPVFIYICGEWICTGVPQLRTWVGVLAQKLQGLILVLQHRFYGDSLPFGKESFSIDNMRLLNSEQALRDLAFFIQDVKSTQSYGVTNNPWISVGGSYPGALSAWFRIKYPHLVIGSLASSAVVLAVQDFKDFDEQIYLSSVRSGDYCVDVLNASNHRVESILYSSQEASLLFKSQFPGGMKLSNDQFLFFWADSIVLTIQYGGRTDICQKLKGKTEDEQFDIIKQNALLYEVYEYSSYWLRNQTMTYETRSAARPWYYQYCTQYGFFQTFSDRHPMRSFRLDLNFFRKFCSDAFGVGTWAKVNIKNMEYGGLYDKSTNIIFSNGIQDPWRWASLQHTDNRALVTRVIDCPDCAHCVDLYTPEFSDADNLKKARDQQYLTISGWIETYWSDLHRSNMEKLFLNEI